MNSFEWNGRQLYIEYHAYWCKAHTLKYITCAVNVNAFVEKFDI